MNNDILSLQEISDTIWLAKYSGNYGTYTIKINIENGIMTDFSCSCPSQYYPCKHIAIIQNAIEDRIAENMEALEDATITVEELLQNVPQQELITFIAKQARSRPELSDAIFLEFLKKLETRPEEVENNYALILRKALEKVHFDDDDLYDIHDSSLGIDILDIWLAKAKEYISQNRHDEAIAIGKACIEEYASWLEETDSDIIEYIDPLYQDKPFDLLSEIALNPAVNSNDLFRYCITEMNDPKYESTGMDDNFNDLVAELADNSNAEEFIASQDSLLKSIVSKSSFQAEKIITRKIAFYKKINQPAIAWQLVTENIQIESFRKQLVESKIADGKFAEAKTLISDCLSTYQNKNSYTHEKWNELILDIAQREADLPTIRRVSFAFIENRFQVNYYRIYKDSFTQIEWENELRKIIAHYQKKDNNFSQSVAGVYIEEKDAFSLLKYIENQINIERMDQYHTHFASVYPKETLDLFRKVIDQFAAINTGRDYYKYLINLFGKMVLIEGGKEMVRTMITQYKIQYKNRRAMVELLNKVTL